MESNNKKISNKGEKMIKYLVGLYGRLIGWIMVLSPIVYDVLMRGLRDYEQVKVCWGGCLIMILGAIIVRISVWCRKTF